jgi:DNA segregation ATPase FtsK/SpoIIIE-like protein
LFVFIDELKALIDDSNVAAPYLARIAAAGAEFGLHLVLATQYPQIKMLGSAELKRNLSTRLCGKVDSADAASNALGLPDTGAESLQGYGDFLLRDFHGLARLTVAKLESTHVEQSARADVGRLDLPEPDEVYQEPRPRNQPDPYQAEEVALALFHPELGINKLAERLGIGNTKATRTRRFAEAIHAWGLAQGFTQLKLVAPDNEQTPRENNTIRLWPGSGNGHRNNLAC